MTVKRRLGSIKRFGPRYGRGVKIRFGVIEAEQRQRYPCPYCRAVRVKRVAAGIWQCRKCGSKFAAKAYTANTRQAEEELKHGVHEARPGAQAPAAPAPEIAAAKGE